MIRYKEIAFIAYPVTDMTRARKFYEGILDLKPNARVCMASDADRFLQLFISRIKGK